jgi:hypothetical protein
MLCVLPRVSPCIQSASVSPRPRISILSRGACQRFAISFRPTDLVLPHARTLASRGRPSRTPSPRRADQLGSRYPAAAEPGGGRARRHPTRPGNEPAHQRRGDLQSLLRGRARSAGGRARATSARLAMEQPRGTTSGASPTAGDHDTLPDVGHVASVSE